MKKPLKPKIHIYFSEASHRGNKVLISEYFYIQHSFQRLVTKAMIVPYANEHKIEFDKQLRNKFKKNSTNSKDLFYIVLDTDFYTSGKTNHIIIKQINELYNEYKHNVKYILSSRSFEVWLCMYNQSLYTKQFTTKADLNTDVDSSYDKSEKWYISNKKKLFDGYLEAKVSSIRSKQSVFNSSSPPPPTSNDIVDLLPDLSNQGLVSYLVNTNPFTYFEHLIEDLLAYREPI